MLRLSTMLGFMVGFASMFVGSRYTGSPEEQVTFGAIIAIAMFIIYAFIRRED